MRIGIVTDEISPDIGEALSLGLGWGIKDFELRCIGSERVPSVSEGALRTILDFRAREGIRITALSPGVFKGQLADTKVVKREIETVLPACFEMAKRIDCPKVIVFGFKRDESCGAEREVAGILGKAAALAGAQGLTLLVENEPGCWCDSGSNTARMIESAGSPFLKANWDTANAVGQGEAPFPEGYEHIRKFVGGVHVKDTRTHTLDKCVPVGEGVVDWKGQLAALVRDGQVDLVTVETHCLPLVEMSKRNIERVRVLLGV